MKHYIAEISYQGEVKFTLKKGEIMSLDLGLLDRGDVSNIIDFGLYSNTATLSFMDKNKQFAEFIKDKKSREVMVSVYFKGTETSSKKICDFYLDTYEYDDESKVVNLSLVDGLIRTQLEKKVEEYRFDERSFNDFAHYFALSNVRGIVNNINVNLNGNIYCPRIVANSVWGGLSDICVAGVARGFLDGERNLNISRDEPTDKQYKNAIVLLPRKILGISNETSSDKTNYAHIKFYGTSREKRISEILGKKHSFQWFAPPISTGEFPWSGNGEIPSTILYRTEGETTRYPINVSTSGYVDVPESTYSVDKDCKISGTMLRYAGVLWDYPVTSFEDGDEYTFRYSPQLTPTSFDPKNKRVRISFSETGFENITDNSYGRFTSGQVWVTGNYYEDGNDTVVEIGDINSPSTDFPKSTLVQTQNTSTNSNLSMLKEQVEYFRRRYYGGVDCCEIECLFGDYYNENGEKVISYENSETFSRGDIIIPYVMKRGETKPYKTYNDGTPKKFVVIGIKYYYNGHPTQKLMLQEYKRHTMSGSWFININATSTTSQEIDFSNDEVRSFFYDGTELVYSQVGHIYFDKKLYDGTNCVIAIEPKHGNLVTVLTNDGRLGYTYLELDDFYELTEEGEDSSLLLLSFADMQNPTVVTKDFYDWMLKNSSLEYYT